MSVNTKVKPLNLETIENTLDTMFWVAARSEHADSYNVHIYNLLAIVDELNND